MKNKILLGFAWICIMVGSFLIGAGFQARRDDTRLPSQHLPIGFAFQIPTVEGPITLTVKEAKLMRAYLIEDQNGQSDTVPERTVEAWLEMLEIPLPK